MPILSRITNFLRDIVAREKTDRDLDAEVRSYSDLLAHEKMREGMSPQEARRNAILELGGIEQVKEQVREARAGAWLDSLFQDLRYGARMLRKNPGFTAIAVLTLALGIGANTAIFSVVNAVLLRPFPYPEPARLLTMESNQSLPDLDDIQKQAQSFEALGGTTMQRLDYTGGAEPIQIFSINCNSDLFRALRTQPALGRLLSQNDDRFGAPGAVVLSHGFWTRQFGADPNIIGRSIPLSGNSYTVVGVLPANFWIPGPTGDVYAALRVIYPAAAQARGVHFLRTYLRLKPGVTLAQAQSEMDGIDKSLALAYPDFNQDRRSRLMPLLEKVVGDSRPALLVLFGAVGLVLMIACVNFANLLLARGASRQREIAIRSALGAGSRRLIAQMLVESTMLSLAGGAAGILLAQAGVKTLLALAPENLPRLTGIAIDSRALAFTLGISILTGTVFGLLPAWSAARLNLGEGLKESGRSLTGSRTTLRMRRILVVSETVLAMMLLVGAGLLIRSFQRMHSVSGGFRPDNILTMRVELPAARYEEAVKQRPFRARLLDSLNALPAVQAAMISELPMSGDYRKTIVGVVGDVKHFGLDQPEQPAVYDLYSQMDEPWKRWMTLAVRSPRDPGELTRAVEAQIWALDRGIPPTAVLTMNDVMDASVTPRKFNLTLMMIFAGVALALAAIGIYGVVAFSVTQRTHEIGVRVTLGAQQRDIVRLVLGEGARLALLGAVLGLTAASALTRFMASLLFGVSIHDPLTFFAVAAVLVSVAGAACCIPARRAMRVDPMVALRYE